MRLLSFDGGPSAALQIRILESVERYAAARGQDMLGRTDVFAGSSDGAFMASFLALRLWQGQPAGPALVREAVQFSNELLDVFQVSLWDMLCFATGLRPLLPDSGVRNVLTKYLGTATLGDLAGPGPTGAPPRHLLLMSFDIKTWLPKQFKNFGALSGQDLTTPLVEAVMASSAFPMLLPIRTHGVGQFVDGAVVANNPTMSAIAGLVRWMQSQRGGPARDLLADITTLSLGAHEDAERRHREERGLLGWLRDLIAKLISIPKPPRGEWGSMPWGWLQWFLLRPLYLLDLFFQASVEEVSIQAASLLDHQYFRCSPALDEMTEIFGVLLGDPDKLESWLDDQAAEFVARSPQYQELLLWLGREWFAADAKTSA